MLKIQTPPAKFATQEKLYLTLRKKEGRLYSDTEVSELPYISKDHPLIKEWKVRKHSSQRLIRYLSKLERPLRILEIGCGNGWLCKRLSSIKDSNITGLDINMLELEQAEKVFGTKANISFIYGDIVEGILPLKSFDVIVLGSSLQYFVDAKAIIERLILLLGNNGEVHIFDSPIYKTPEEALEAKERSTKYFESMGAKDMAQYYSHHTYDFLKKFNYTVIQPNLRERVLGLNRFPWIIIKQG
jgi:ubiquinone/menaquinone biosynthesis C-methylase UbiE